MSGLSSITSTEASCGDSGPLRVCVALPAVIAATASRASSDAPAAGLRSCAGAAASGRETRNVEPIPDLLSTCTRPPCAVTSSCTSARPSPEPGTCSASSLPRWNGSKMCGSSLAAMPRPVSETARVPASPGPRVSETRMRPPCRENLMALEIRLTAIFSSASTVVCSVRSSIASGARSSPRSTASDSNEAMACRTTGAASTGAVGSAWPLLRRARLSIWSTRRSRRLAFRLAVAR